VTRRSFGVGAAALLALAGIALQIATFSAWPLQAQTLTPTPGPYAGQQDSSIRGLTEAEIASFREARGMGLARPADINGYPGPIHVLELSDALSLNTEQREAMQSLYDQMRGEAVSLGEEFLSQYGALEGAFRDRTVTTEVLDRHAAELGRLEGRLRATHLKYHLLTAGHLTKEQIAEYGRLRGYTEVAAPAEPAPDSGHRPGMQHRAATSTP
jgi:hypothetical protein